MSFPEYLEFVLWKSNMGVFSSIKFLHLYIYIFLSYSSDFKQVNICFTLQESIILVLLSRIKINYSFNFSCCYQVNIIYNSYVHLQKLLANEIVNNRRIIWTRPPKGNAYM